MTTETPEIATEYAGPVQFEQIDFHIAWAEEESKKPGKGDWNQTNWGKPRPSCGTAFCIAGHAAALAGARPAFQEKTFDPRFRKRGEAFAWVEDWISVIRPEAVPDELHYVTIGDYDRRRANALGDDSVVWTEKFGTELLGLGGHINEDESMPLLFAANNSIVDLKRIRDAYAVAEGYPTKYGYGDDDVLGYGFEHLPDDEEVL